MPRKAADLDAALARAAESLQAFRAKPRPKLAKPCPLPLAREFEAGGGRVVVECAHEGLARSVDIGGVTAHVSPSGKIQYPPQLRGMNVRDLPAMVRDRAAVKAQAVPARFQRFSGPGAAIAALMKANPGLGNSIGRIWGSKLDSEYQAWVASLPKRGPNKPKASAEDKKPDDATKKKIEAAMKKGYRSPRPTLESVYGDASTAGLPKIDFLRGFADKSHRAGKTYHSFHEALYASVPKSGKWEDWLPVLRAIQAEINAHAAEDDYIQPWLEIKIPGRAGRELERQAALDPDAPDRVLEHYRDQGKQARTVEKRIDDEALEILAAEEVPF